MYETFKICRKQRQLAEIERQEKSNKVRTCLAVLMTIVCTVGLVIFAFLLEDAVWQLMLIPLAGHGHALYQNNKTRKLLKAWRESL